MNAVAKWIADGERFDTLPLPGPEPVPMVELEELCLSVGGAAQVWLNPVTGKVVVRRVAAEGAGK